MTDTKRPGGDPPGSAVPGPGDDHASAQAIVRLTQADLSTAERRRALRVVADALRLRGITGFVKPRAIMGRVGDLIVDVAPRIPLRARDTLRTHYPGLPDEQVADHLVRVAGRTSAAIGAVGGGLAAVQWAAPPVLLTAPAVLAAETVAVVAVELKLIGELRELYGQPVAGTLAQRGLSLLQAWSGRRGVNLLVPGRSAATVLSTAARHELRDRLMRRYGRNLTTLGPLLTGAAVAAYLNRRATLKLAAEVREDLTAKRSGVLPG